MTGAPADRHVASLLESGSGSGSGEHPIGADAVSGPAGRIQMVCPHCRAGLRVEARYLGRRVRCGGCRGKFRVEPSQVVDVLDAPAPTVDHPLASTPDPDDPWQGRIEVMRLLDEIAALKARDARLAAEVKRLERELDAAPRQVPEPPTVAFDHVEAAPFTFHNDVAAAAGG